jgi:hypothetical protein
MAASIDTCAAMATMTISVALRRNNRIKRCTDRMLLIAKRGWIDRGEPAHDGVAFGAETRMRSSARGYP